MTTPADDLIQFMTDHARELSARDFHTGLVALQDYADELGEAAEQETERDLSVTVNYHGDGEQATIKFPNLDRLADWYAIIVKDKQ